jgi:hypothetical protein
MKSIIMSAPSVLSTLKDLKTQTRRKVGPGNSTVNGRRPNPKHSTIEWCDGWSDLQWGQAWTDGCATKLEGEQEINIFGAGKNRGFSCGEYIHVPCHPDHGGSYRVRSRIQPGDIAYVKEAWRTRDKLDSLSGRQIERAAREVGYKKGQFAPVRYDADSYFTTWGDNDRVDFGDWGRLRSPLFMPEWASRLRIEITSVRCERLQEITEEDAIAEGVEAVPAHGKWCDPARGREGHWSYRKAYARRWESIHGPGAWEENPWVFAYGYRRVA